jgi:hypothetical protein
VTPVTQGQSCLKRLVFFLTPLRERERDHRELLWEPDELGSPSLGLRLVGGRNLTGRLAPVLWCWGHQAENDSLVVSWCLRVSVPAKLPSRGGEGQVRVHGSYLWLVCWSWALRPAGSDAAEESDQASLCHPLCLGQLSDLDFAGGTLSNCPQAVVCTVTCTPRSPQMRSDVRCGPSSPDWATRPLR